MMPLLPVGLGVSAQLPGRPVLVIIGLAIVGAIIWAIVGYRQRKQQAITRATLHRVLDNGKAKSQTIDEMVDAVCDASRALLQRLDERERDDLESEIAKLNQLHATAYATWAGAVQRASSAAPNELAQAIEDVHAAQREFVAYEPSIGQLQAKVDEITEAIETFGDAMSVLERREARLTMALTVARQIGQPTDTIVSSMDESHTWQTQAQEQYAQSLYIGAHQALRKAQQAQDEAIASAKAMGIYT